MIVVEGLVDAVDDSRIWVRCLPSSCLACGKICISRRSFDLPRSELHLPEGCHLSLGDRVSLGIAESVLLKHAILVYGGYLLGIFAGAGLFVMLFSLELYGLPGALFGALLTFVIIQYTGFLKDADYRFSILDKIS